MRRTFVAVVIGLVSQRLAALTFGSQSYSRSLPVNRNKREYPAAAACPKPALNEPIRDRQN
jgi:hypothetical protein